jgi:hypothetical protein
MKIVVKISFWLVFYSSLLLAMLLSFVIYWSYNEKKKIPSKIIDNIERVFENISPKSKMFIGDAEVEFLSFAEGFSINLENSYIEFGKDVFASAPAIKARIKLSDLLFANIKFGEVDIEKPKFVFSEEISADEFAKTASKDFLILYKNIIYNIFSNINNQNNTLIESLDFNNAEFSFNKNGIFQTWKVDKANFKFFNLQNKTYLSTLFETKLYGRESKINVNARLLDADRLMLKVDYENLPSKIITNFADGMAWIDNLKPILNGTSSVVMDKAGDSTTISLENNIEFEKEEISDTKIGLNGVIDLIKNEEDIVKPKIKAEIALKDVNMEKLPILWPEKYGSDIRNEVLKNYTNGKFSNVAINIDFEFEDVAFNQVVSEKFSIKGNMTDTDIIYNPEFPPLEKATGSFFYDGDNVEVDVEKAFLGELEFGKTRAKVEGINNVKTILTLEGTATGQIASLKPLLNAIMKGRDKEFFYNTRDITADSQINFYYKDNINYGFDSEVVDMNISAKLNNVLINNAIDEVNLKSSELQMDVTHEGLKLIGDVTLNNSPSQIKVWVGFVKENDIGLNVVSEAETFVLDKLVPGVAKFADGILELEFEYKSEGERNYFAGKVDSADAKINIPYLAWNKEKGTFASITFGGQYQSEKFVELSQLQIVTGDSISTGNMIVSLNPEIADEVYFNSLNTGNNNAEVYFNRSQSKYNGKYSDAYILKITGKSFDASKLVSSFQNIAGGENSLIFDMKVDKLIMAENIDFSKVSAALRCNIDRCFNGSFNGKIDDLSNVEGVYKLQDSNNLNSAIDFKVTSNNAGKIIKAFGLSNNIEGGELNISGNVSAMPESFANGSLQIFDYRLTEAPLLTKILSLASLTGITNLLSDKGVPMKRLTGNFSMKDNFISITDVRSYGNSLGFTVQGNVNLKDTTLDLSGAVTPSYSINSMLGNIPLLGNLFKGKEGEGLIATNYKVSGKYPDVKITVNPLSALTPGFLRNIWGNSETNIDKKREQIERKKQGNINKNGFTVNAKPAR